MKSVFIKHVILQGMKNYLHIIIYFKSFETILKYGGFYGQSPLKYVIYNIVFKKG